MILPSSQDDSFLSHFFPPLTALSCWNLAPIIKVGVGIGVGARIPSLLAGNLYCLCVK